MRHATPIALRIIVAAWLKLSCAIPAWRLPDGIEPWHLVLGAFTTASLSQLGALDSTATLRFVEDAFRLAMGRSALLMAVWYLLRPDDTTLWLMATHDTACYAWGLSRRPACGGWTRAALVLIVLFATPSITRSGAIVQMPWEPMARASLLTLLFTEMADAIAR
jgi:hypothetical protein